MLPRYRCYRSRTEADMSSRKNLKAAERGSGQRVMNLGDPSMKEGKLKALGGSKADPFNNVIANQAASTPSGPRTPARIGAAVRSVRLPEP